MTIRNGTRVSWPWGRHRAEGTVRGIHRETVSRTIKGSEITRHGSAEDPAYEIEQDDGTTVLKLRSEVEQV
jgi:Hypervirulence associated proteins TUDOR domain